MLKSFPKVSAWITNHTGSSSGKTERSSAAKHSSQRGRGEGERPREEGRAGEQRHHGGQVQLSSIIFFFLFKNMSSYNTCRKDRIFESPAKWARICHCRPDWYHCLRCESSFAFATLIGLVEEIKITGLFIHGGWLRVYYRTNLNTIYISSLIDINGLNGSEGDWLCGEPGLVSTSFFFFPNRLGKLSKTF